MSSDVPELPLKSLCLLVVDCPHSTPLWTDSGVVVLRNQNIKAGRLDLSNPSYTDEAHYLGRIKRAAPRADDLVITREAPMGEICQIPAGLKCCLGQRQVLLRPNPDKVNSRYLLYALQSPYLQHQIGWNEGTGSTVSNLRIPVLEVLRVPTPPLHVQKEVARILGAVDDRIALLQETNKTLESIAQAIFKSWFVDFDPVRAKMEGRQPEGMDEETAALFPDSFEESELGLVPRGWSIATIESICDTISNGATPSRSKDDYWHLGSIPWIKTGELADGFLISSAEKITEKALAETSVKLLPENAVLMAIYAAPTVGRLGILTQPSTFNQACTGLVAKKQVGTWFLLWTLFFGRSWFNSRANGAAQQNISKKIVENYKLVLPTSGILTGFGEISSLLHQKIRANAETISTLSSLRDTLLPRLISGQLRLPEAQELTEAALP